MYSNIHTERRGDSESVLSLSLSPYIYTNIYTYTNIYILLYILIYILLYIQVIVNQSTTLNIPGAAGTQ
jgi:hypothetical protein